MSKLITPDFGPIVRVGEEGSDSSHRDEFVTEKTIGGPLAGKDVRLYLEASALRHLLEVAEASSVKRAQINGVGVKVRLWRTPTGHHYETWQIVGFEPKAERFGLVDGAS